MLHTRRFSENPKSKSQQNASTNTYESEPAVENGSHKLFLRAEAVGRIGAPLDGALPRGSLRLLGMFVAALPAILGSDNVFRIPVCCNTCGSSNNACARSIS